MKKVTTRLIQDLPPTLLADIKRRGLFRCGVVIPNCPQEPVAELGRTDGIHRLFCRRHMRESCAQYGVPEPVYPSDGN